jgi:hypothetical protein
MNDQVRPTRVVENPVRRGPSVVGDMCVCDDEDSHGLSSVPTLRGDADPY